MRLFCCIVALAPLLTFAQEAGGYSAGPSQNEPTYRPVDADGGSDFSTKVVGHRASPSFTQDREFTTTRVWVLDPGKFTVEQWWNGFYGAPRAKPGPNADDHFFQTEIEMGIAPHLQVDIYANYEFNQDAQGNLQVALGGHTGIAAELRVAIGSYWGQYFGNPTLYFELTSQYYNSPRGEFRVLLGDSLFGNKLLWAVNLLFERNIFRDPSSGIDYEIKADFGLNYELVPNILRLGVEGVLGFDSHGGVDEHGHALLHPVAWLGPSVLLTEPHKRIKLLAAVFHGFADFDQPWITTFIVSTTF